MKRYAIRHTFPNGKVLGDGLVKSGTRSDHIVTDDAGHIDDMIGAMVKNNPGHRFEAVEAPQCDCPGCVPYQHTGFEAGAL